MLASTGRTVRREVTVQGTGLHTGKPARVTVAPRERWGVEFVREDLPGGPRVAALAENLAPVRRRTVLQCGGAEVQTAEHLLAALYALGVDRAEVRIYGPELPALDGSSLGWVNAIREVGLREVQARRRRLVLHEAVAEVSGDAAIVAVPCCEGLVIDYILDHDSEVVPVQRVSFKLNEKVFVEEIAPARTFVLEEEARALLQAGFGRGASTENTLVVGPQGVRDNTLRFPDEFARHKVLDLVGDLCLVGADLEARVVGVRSGHGLNALLVKRLAALLEEQSAEAGEDTKS